jgi:hypothetical protein
MCVYLDFLVGKLDRLPLACMCYSSIHCSSSDRVALQAISCMPARINMSRVYTQTDTITTVTTMASNYYKVQSVLCAPQRCADTIAVQ